MSEMIERVARAICRTTFEGLSGEALDAQVEECWYVWEDAARAAIEAMRKPTAEMVQSRIDCYPRELRIRGGDMEVWWTMIDAALAEGTEAAGR